MAYNFTYEQLTYNQNSISIKNFDLSINEKILFKESSLILSYGYIYGLIGKNGYGKTSLVKQLPILCIIKNYLLNYKMLKKIYLYIIQIKNYP